MCAVLCTSLSTSFKKTPFALFFGLAVYARIVYLCINNCRRLQCVCGQTSVCWPSSLCAHTCVCVCVCVPGNAMLVACCTIQDKLCSYVVMVATASKSMVF